MAGSLVVQEDLKLPFPVDKGYLKLAYDCMKYAMS
jgi:hypothetical protein